MSPDVNVCPNCGAYVMSGDHYCPRCDHHFEPDDHATPGSEARRPDDVTDITGLSPEDRAHLPTTELPPIPPRAGAESPGAVAFESPADPADPADPAALTEGLPDAPPADPLTGTESLPPHDHPERQELRAGLAQAAAAFDPAAPTDLFAPVEPADPAEMPTAQRPVSIIPPAPYTSPPPAALTPPPGPAYVGQYGRAPDSTGHLSAGYLLQRIQAYQQGGYRVVVTGPYEATLAMGKRMGMGGWLLALVTGIGLLWYLLLLALSGFQADSAYLVVEADGRVYEDGPGAAHVRRSRSRAGRRWSLFGLLIFGVSLLLSLVLGAAAGIVLTQDRYQAALREAYPAVTLFEEQLSSTQANADDVQLAKDSAVVFAILGGIALVGVWGGATLFVIGAVHAGAYRVHVPPLPGFA